MDNRILHSVSSRYDSTIIAVEAHRDELSWRLRDVSTVFQTGSLVEYQRITPANITRAPVRRSSATRALTRTQKLVEEMKGWCALPASANTGLTVLRNRRSGAHFVEVQWTRRSGHFSRHWLRIQPPVMPQEDAPTSIRFVTGTCLFGRSDAIAFLADGSRRSLVSARLPLASPIERLAIRDELSAYEADTACRLSTVICSMGESLRHRGSAYVHIPVPEYVLFMLGQQRGPSSGTVMREWLEAVERRGAIVGQLFNALFTAQSPTLEVNVGSPLDDIVMPYLREAISRDRLPSVHDIVELVRSSGTPVGDALGYWLANRGGGDIGYHDLSQFGYVAGVLIQLQSHGGLVVEVENPSEEPIFRTASRLIKRAHDATLQDWTGNLMAVYPHEQTIEPCEGVLDWYTEAESDLSDELFGHIMRQYGVFDLRRDAIRGLRTLPRSMSPDSSGRLQMVA
jgi:hypothetical protein